MLIEEMNHSPQVLTMYPRVLLSSLLRKSNRMLPEQGLRLANVNIDRKHLSQYQSVCGFMESSTLPVTYPHMLAFPLHMALMTRTDFPFPLLGLVHIANRITQHRPLPSQQPLSIECRLGNLQSHDKGQAFSVITQVSMDAEVVWESVSTMLHRQAQGKSSKPVRESKHPAVAPTPSDIWFLDEGLGRRYARVSGDFNPIHLHALSARLFGFPQAIAHGMWSKARCLAALQPDLPDTYEVDVQFKLPILLPAQVGFSCYLNEHQRLFGLHDMASGKPHLQGTIIPR